ncbi:MAG: glycosyltransferase [Candidatus Thiodiazotropha sp.]
MSDRGGVVESGDTSVSVIVRTKNRVDLLAQALRSIAEQTHTAIDVVVVNDGGESIDRVIEEFKESPFSVNVVVHETCRGRSAAANSGLEVAEGAYLLFLDDDDLLLADHISRLSKSLDENPEFGAVYGDIESVDSEGNSLHVYSQEFNQTLFLAASFLPIHAVLFRRQFIDDGLRFNESLAVYEDWDFWARLAEVTTIQHVPGAGGIYRNIGDSKVGNVGSDTSDIKKNRLKLYESWLGRWDAENMRELFDGILELRSEHDHDKISLSETIAELNQQMAAQQGSIGQLQGVIGILEARVAEKQQTIDDKEQAIQHGHQIIDHLNRNNIRLSGEIKALRNHIAHLESLVTSRDEEINTLYQSTTWKIAKPLRSLISAVNNLKALMHRPVAGALTNGELWPLYYYQKWLKHTGIGRGMSAAEISACQAKLNKQPKFSVVMPVYNPQPKFLREAIDSVVEQSYSNWEFCIADDNSTDVEVKKLLEKMQATDERIKVIFREENGHISRATNSAIEVASGEYVVLLDHDDRLNPDALLWVALELNKAPDANVIFSDEDKISEKGDRSQPYFKGDWNYDLLLSHNVISHLGVYKRTLLEEIGGFRVGLEGSQDYDLALRCIERSEADQIRHIPRVLYHWRACEGSTALAGSEKSYALIAAGKAIREHLDRIGQTEAEVITLPAQGAHRVKYPLPDESPLVSLVLVVADSDELSLQQSLLSVLDITEYSSLEIILAYREDQSKWVDPALAGFTNTRYPLKKIIDSGSWSDQVNAAVSASTGDLIGLISAAVEIKEPNWLDELVRHALRPDVGVAGARILYQDNSVQHAGMILKPDQFPGFPFQGPKDDQPGYFGRALLIQSFSVLSPACFVFQKRRFEEVGGMTTQPYNTVMAAIDFCLKLKEKSYIHTWTPYSEVYFTREACYPFDPSSDAQQADLSQLQALWKPLFDADPAYNPNLSLRSLYTGLSDSPRIQPC